MAVAAVCLKYGPTDYYYGVYYPDIDKVVNSGNIDTSGGDSLEVTSAPGNASYVWIWGYNGVTNSGNIAAGGGDDLGADGLTGYGNDAHYPSSFMPSWARD